MPGYILRHGKEAAGEIDEMINARLWMRRTECEAALQSDTMLSSGTGGSMTEDERAGRARSSRCPIEVNAEVSP